MDEGTADRVRESVRTAVARALAGTAKGLGAASRAAAATANQLRPPEPVDPRRPSPPPSAPSSAAPTGPAGAAPTSPGHGTEDPAGEVETAEDAPSEATTPPYTGDTDVAALAELNARDLVAKVPELTAGDLRLLRAAEAGGKARKTVLAAIDRALED